MGADSWLDVVNDADVVVGRELRSVIHQKGLRHREVHVWFVRPNGNVVFQVRSASKDSHPNRLDATVGGHVELGQTYMQAALCEAEEETGLRLREEELLELCKVTTGIIAPASPSHNLTFRMVYLYWFTGPISDLQVEDGAGAGFEEIPVADVLTRTPETAGGIIPSLLKSEYRFIFEEINKKVQA